MKGVFSFDGPLHKDSNGCYCSTTLTNEMFSRYFAVVDELYVVTRCQKLTQSYDEYHMQPLDTTNIHIIEVDNMLSAKGILSYRRNIKKELEDIIGESDMFFARMPSLISNALISEAKKVGKKVLGEIGGCAWDSYWNHSIRGKLLAPYMFWAEKKYVSELDFAVYVTERFLQKRYPNRNNSTNCSNVYIREDINALQERIDSIEKSDIRKPTFIQVVNSVDVRYKGEQYIIKAMKQLLDYNIEAKYIIVGPGKGNFIKKQAKKYEVEDNVFLLGPKTKDEILMLISKSDLYVQPSKQEGLPRSVIEAMSAACPAVGSRLAGIPELLDDTCLFNPNNTHEIVSVIRNILNKKTLKEQATINHNKAEKYYVDILESRRKNFFLKYRESIENIKG